MQLATLDMIVRKTLLERRKPLHYYLEYLVHGSAAIRELSKDSMRVVNAATLPVGSYNEVNLPPDFKDDVSVCIPVGGLLQPISKRYSINPLRVHDETTGAFEARTDDTNLDTNELTFFGINTSFFWYWNVNDYGEPTGRYFGANGGAHQNGYKVIRERRQIQLTGAFTSDKIVLLYVSNGQSVDNASQIDYDAIAAIQAYCDWKTSPNAKINQSYEAMNYYNERRLFRANKNDLTKADILNILRSSSTAAIKS